MMIRCGFKLFIALIAIAALPAASIAQEAPKPAKKATEEKSKGLQFELHFDNLLFEIGNDKSDDKKIKEIEARIAELTKQLQALKQGKQPAEAPKKGKALELKVDGKDLESLQKALEQAITKKFLFKLAGAEQGPMPSEAPKGKVGDGKSKTIMKFIGPDGKEITDFKALFAPEPKEAAPKHHPMTAIGIIVDEPASKPIALSRATYKLPKEKAEALMTFLKTNTKPAVLEFKFDDKGLTVTTTPEFQTAIASIVNVMRPGPELQFRLWMSDEKK